MRRFLLSAAALLLLPVGGAAIAQNTQPDDSVGAGAAQPTDEDIRRGAIILRAFDTVVSSEEADEALKAQLFGCIFNNSVRQISAAAGKVLAANENLDASDPKQVYAAAAVACGVKPTAGPEAGNSGTVEGR